MIERREELKKEIKEVADRIEVKLGEYRTKYYKNIPVNSRKKICHLLEKAVIETEELVFYNKKSSILVL